VIWVVALLSVMALDVLAAARREDSAAQDLALRARLDAAADAGLVLAIGSLLAADAGAARGRAAGAAFRPGAPALEEGFEGVRLSIAIEDEAGKVDLNRATRRVLQQLFEALGEPAARAEALAAAIEDWRDDDEEPAGPLGAEAPAYRRARQALLPRDGHFQSVDEVRHVLGMSAELFARAAPHLTVHGQREAPDPAVVGPLVQRAVGGTAARAAPAQPARPARPTRTRGGEPVAGPPLSPLTGRAFRVQVEAAVAGGLRRRAAVVRLTGNPREPYWVQEYR
jgi:general secretion pathway protein K